MVRRTTDIQQGGAANRLVLRDGSVAAVRRATPADRKAVRRFDHDLSAESREAEAAMWLRAVGVWLLLLLLAVMNGAFREAVLGPALGVQAAHVVSTAMLSAAIAILTFLTIGWIGARTDSDALFVGLLWMMLVLAFEFLAGHFLFGRSWQYLLADYDVLAGRVWVAVPLVTLFAPLSIIHLRSSAPWHDRRPSGRPRCP